MACNSRFDTAGARLVLGFDYEQDTRSVFSDFEDMLHANPLGRIPALILDDEEVLIDSAAILDYLDQSVGPERLSRRNHSPRLETHADGGPEQRLFFWTRHPRRRIMSKPPVTEHGGPVGWPQMSLYLTVRDPEASLKFYQAAFGFEPFGESMRDEAGDIQHAEMRRGDAAIMFAPEQAANPMKTPVTSGAQDSHSFYIYVADVDALARNANAAGATELQAPADQFWGDRIAIYRCPNGYHWTFATHVAEMDLSKAPLE